MSLTANYRLTANSDGFCRIEYFDCAIELARYVDVLELAGDVDVRIECNHRGVEYRLLDGSLYEVK